MVGDFIGDGGEESMEYVRLSDLKKVPGIGEKTMERIREKCERFIDSSNRTRKNKDLSKWLDDIFEGL